jgi:hypothetical protein
VVHPIVELRQAKATFTLSYEDLLQDSSKIFYYVHILECLLLHINLKDKLLKKDTVMRKSITTKERLAITLR